MDRPAACSQNSGLETAFTSFFSRSFSSFNLDASSSYSAIVLSNSSNIPSSLSGSCCLTKVRNNSTLDIFTRKKLLLHRYFAAQQRHSTVSENGLCHFINRDTSVSAETYLVTFRIKLFKLIPLFYPCYRFKVRVTFHIFHL